MRLKSADTDFDIDVADLALRVVREDGNFFFPSSCAGGKLFYFLLDFGRGLHGAGGKIVVPDADLLPICGAESFG